MKLDGKVAIITGATSGMGRDTAYLFAKEGAKVVITGRNEERAKEVVENIKADGGEASYLIIDMSDLEQVKQIVPKVLDLYGTVDILMNNAGMLSVTPIQQITLEEWTKVFNVNLTSSMLLAQAVAPIMKEKGKGSIINTSSVAGYAAMNGPVAYTTSKHAMEGLNKAMANELGPEIRANAIAPGAIETAMLDSVGGAAGVQPMIDAAPLKRVGVGHDIATVALFLATDDSSFVTGQSLKVDGGFMI